MSFAQWRLWFLEQLRPGTNAWNTPVVARLHGPLNIAALRGSLAIVVERHATLRTVFEPSDVLATPVVLADPPVQVPVVDLEREPAPELSVQRLVAEEVRRPFDLESDLMVRVRLLRLAPEDHVFILVAHHIACDGWSKGVLLEDLSAAYNAICDGDDPSLPDLPMTYADHAAWQRRWLTGENADRLSAYWRDRLAGHAPALALRTDRRRPPMQEFRGAVEWLAVPSALADAAAALARRERATPFMTVLAAFKALLHGHSGQDDLLVGSPAAMRDQPGTERIVGLFANTLVYRTDLSGEPSFRELVARVRATALGVYQHQGLPFDKIVEAVRPRRDASRNPLVQVNLRLEGSEPRLTLCGLRCEPVVIDPGLARFDLAIELGATEDGLAGYLEYNTELFEQPTAAALARDFVAVLAAAVASPDRPLADLEPMRAIRARGQARRWTSS
jgi:hypothetical protein